MWSTAVLNLGGPNLCPWFLVLFKNSSNTEAGSSSLKPLRILKVSMSRARSLLSSRVKSPRSAILLLYPLWRIEETNLVARACTFSRCYTSTGLIGDQNWALYSSSSLTSALYRASTVFFKMLFPLSQYPLYIAQDLLRHLLRTNTLRRALEVRPDDNPYIPFFVNAGYLRTKKRIVQASA